MGHESQNRENCKTSYQAGRTVQQTERESISARGKCVSSVSNNMGTGQCDSALALCGSLPVAVIVVFVVTPHGNHAACAHSIRKQHLAPSVQPHLHTT